MTTSLLIDLTLPVCLGVGFFAGYVLNRSLISPAYLLIGATFLVALGMVLAFSLPGFGLILTGLLLFGLAAGAAVRRTVARLG